MIILGIESSCDDTSVALIKANENNFKILAEKTASQIEVHKKYGGVVPEIAGRCHAENITPLIEEIMNHLTPNPSPYKGEGKIVPDVIAVTSGPGLITGLLVGVETAKSLSYLWDVPIVAVNHIEGHIYSPLIPSPQGEESLSSKIIKGSLTPSGIRDFELPALALIVSGGHTELILMEKQGVYKKIGGTKDDAAGECFDKVAKLLNFDYPGGPKISKFAETGDTNAIPLPRPMIHDDNFDFSFSGLKTAALYWLQNHSLPLGKGEIKRGLTKDCQPPLAPPFQGGEISVSDFCASFEQAIIDVLVTKTLKAVKRYEPKTVILGGGVAANKKLRETLQKEITAQEPKSIVYSPKSNYAMDNATMIAMAGYYKALQKDFTNWNDLKADPNWHIA